MRLLHYGLPWLAMVASQLFAWNVGIAAGQSNVVANNLANDLAPLLKTLREVEREGKGNRAASQAWAELTARAQADDLPAILAEFDGAGPLAANWLRAAVDAIAERQLNSQGKLPSAELERFLSQTTHNPRARRLAYEWLARDDPSAPDRLIPRMLDDPSLELRRDAVARLLSAAEAATSEENTSLAMQTYVKALQSARDLDQLKIITETLKKAGRPVDLAHYFGFIVDWQLVGPFDNRQGKGFDAVYPPEASVNLSASYETPAGTVGWIAHQTDDENGLVDLNKALGKHMGAVAYAAAEFPCDKAQRVELRLGSENANKIWLNGKLLCGADVYHANFAMDQYAGAGELVKGRNLILVKLCQNEQTEDWAQDWKFQLRVCDATGKAVLAADRPGPRSAADQTAAKSTIEEPRDATK